MISWFTSHRLEKNPLPFDVHSHLLPGLDDGVETLEEASRIIEEFLSLGYRGAVTTPHVMSDTYRNTSEGILDRLEELQNHLRNNKIPFAIRAAAEYYLDESLLHKLKANESLLTFGRKCLLFETNYITEPYLLHEFVFLAATQGYQPILAHPERYHFMTLKKAENLINRGVLLQINALSLSGYYGKPIQQMAEKLIDQKMVHLIGTDCHHEQHARELQKAFRSKGFSKATQLPLLNYSLDL